MKAIKLGQKWSIKGWVTYILAQSIVIMTMVNFFVSTFVLATVVIIHAWKPLTFSYTTTSIRHQHYHRRSMQLMAEGKTPLVANGKRFEADPGSSLMVVRPLLSYFNWFIIYNQQLLYYNLHIDIYIHINRHVQNLVYVYRLIVKKDNVEHALSV